MMLTEVRAGSVHGGGRARGIGVLPSRRSARRGRQSVSKVTAQAVSGTSVRPNSMLVLGATGTLGRQVVRKALDEGYEVRCVVRPRETSAGFLREWGATTVQCDLTAPEDLPPALVGIHTVVDCATARPEEPISRVDWEAKARMIQACVAMRIQRLVFFSIDKCDKHPDIPLMRVKRCTERYLEASGLNYTVLRLCGFMQPLITSYAVPILDEKGVFGTTDETRIAYQDTQDVARMALAALRTDKTIGRTLTLSGPKSYTSDDVIGLCEKYSGTDAKVTRVPTFLLRAAKVLTSGFQWTKDAADRLAFTEVMTSNQAFEADMSSTYELLGIDESSLTTLEDYLQEYFNRVLKRIKQEQDDPKSTTDFYL